jgi:hypothetical protein
LNDVDQFAAYFVPKAHGYRSFVYPRSISGQLRIH